MEMTRFKKKCLFIYLFRLCWVLVVACGIYVAARGIFSCSTWDLYLLHVRSSLQHADSFIAACRVLSCGMHVGSSSPTKGRVQATCIGSTEFYPLDHQGSPRRGEYNSLFTDGIFIYVDNPKESIKIC